MSDIYGILGICLLSFLLISSFFRGRSKRRARHQAEPGSMGEIVGDMASRIASLQEEIFRLRAENEDLRGAQSMGAPPPHDFDEFMAEKMSNEFRERTRLETAMKIMGVTSPWTVGELKVAFRERVKIFHPDQGGTAQQFTELQAAYEELKPFSKPDGAATH